MPDPVAQFLDDLARDRYSSATIDASRRLLDTVPDILTIDHDGLDAWWASRQLIPDGTDRAAASLAGEQSHLRSFYRWAMQHGLITRNPADWLGKIRQSSTTADPIREGDLSRAMRDATPGMRRMLALGAMAGLRSAEMARITWADIDPDEGVLHVRMGKGSKDRTVPLSGGLLAELGDPGQGHIVTSSTGRTMAPKAVSASIGRYLRSQGVDFTAHKLRARYATRFVAATGDLASAAKALGHASVATTQKYVVASSDTMRKGAEACGRIG
jgi:site-specific recombinase XerD